QTVRIRNLHQPIFVELWRIAHDKIQSFQTDLAHDALGLGHANEGEKFLWGWRDTGTTLIPLRDYPDTPNVVLNMVQKNCPMQNWYVIQITKIRSGGHADGYVTWINCQSWEQMKRVIDDNLPIIKNGTDIVFPA